jgi:hypothetical protein
VSVEKKRFSSRWLLLTAIASAILYAWYIAEARFEQGGRSGFTLFDDAMISMRYARNLAHGSGLLWNPGRPPVEGYSNFLWTIWMSFLQLLPLPQRSVSLWVSLSSAVLLIANLWLIRAMVVRAGGRSSSSVFAVAFCAVCYPLVFWSLRGLEVGLLALLIDAAILLAWRAEDGQLPRRWLLALVLSAMVLVRDDAFIPALIVLVFLAVDARTRGLAKICGLWVVGTLLGHVVFRVAYYGAPLPNTYYLKLAGIPLGVRLTRGTVAVLRTSATELLLPLVLAGLAFTSRPQQRRVWLLATVVLGQLGSTIFLGGDAWEAWGQPDRFVSVAIPALAASAALGIETLWTAPSKRRYFLVVALALGWRAFALAAHDFTPRSFTVTPPVDLHPGFAAVSDASTCVLMGTLVVAAVLIAVSRLRRASWLPAGLCVVVIVAAVGSNWSYYLRGEMTARQIRWDGQNAVFGIRLGELAPSSTVVAVVAAGAIPFFSNLESVDLLGKNDAHIAREPPLERFVPGHDKRDYAYSLQTYSPDVVLELWHHAPEELRAIDALGYRQLPNGMYVRADASIELMDLLEHRLPAYPFTAHRPRTQD